MPLASGVKLPCWLESEKHHFRAPFEWLKLKRREPSCSPCFMSACGFFAYLGPCGTLYTSEGHTEPMMIQRTVCASERWSLCSLMQRTYV